MDKVMQTTEKELVVTLTDFTHFSSDQKEVSKS